MNIETAKKYRDHEFLLSASVIRNLDSLSDFYVEFQAVSGFNTDCFLSDESGRYQYFNSLNDVSSILEEIGFLTFTVVL